MKLSQAVLCTCSRLNDFWQHIHLQSQQFKRFSFSPQLDQLLDMGTVVVPPPAGSVKAEDGTPALLPFTYTISAFRGRSWKERGLELHYKPVQQLQHRPAVRQPSDSYLSVTYPFTTNEVLRDQYQRFSSPFLRVGLLLEDMDAFAADVAARHLGGLPAGYTVVTATLDKVAFATSRSPTAARSDHGVAAPGDDLTAATLDNAGSDTSRSAPAVTDLDLAAEGTDLGSTEQQHSSSSSRDAMQAPLSLNSDLRISGQVSWAGKTSMEVIVEVSSAPAAAAAGGGERQWLHRAIAHFIMVLRPTGSGSSSSEIMHVPQIEPTTKLEKLHFEAAAARAAANRAKRANKRLLGGPEPAANEVTLLYDLAEQQLQRQIQQQEEREASTSRAGSFISRPPTFQQQLDLPPVPISATCQSHLAIMHRQDRNNANNIFGGHLLRLAAELAYSTAVLHAGRHCEAVAMGDVTFKQPVPIGCVLEMRAKVVYTSGPLMRVTVVATKHQQLMRPSTTSELHTSVTNDFTFVLAAAGSMPLRPVEPESLREAVQYLAAHRQHVADGYQAPDLLLKEGMEHVLLAGAP